MCFFIFPRLNRVITALLLILCMQTGFSQANVQLQILGGSVISEGSTVSITQGNTITVRITNTSSSCGNLKIENISLSNTTDFSTTHGSVPINIKPATCINGNKYFDFEVTNISGSCNATTDVTVQTNGNSDFVFMFTISGNPEIHLLGGNPSADILHSSTTTLASNGTYFGVVEEGASITRNYIISNTGSCPLNITAITSSLSDFVVASTIILPNSYTTALPVSISSGSYVVFVVTFTAPISASPGTYTSTLSIANTDNTTFQFDVSAEIFNYNIPGPGGITADFRLWLKSTRGIVKSSSKVSEWKDLGTNGKDAIQPTVANQPTFLDNGTDNINFNPVIKFENDGSTVEQYLYNTDNGFYSQDIFIVMIPDAAMSSASSRSTIFAGDETSSAGDITGISFGNSTTRFTNETLTYNQGTEASYNGFAELNSSYSNAGIINVRNDAIPETAQEILYNSVQLTTSSVNDVSYANVGSTDVNPPYTVLGTPYWIGRNYDIQGSLNGRVAEIFTFAERIPDADRQKIESYLAIKYGITLGSSTQAQKDYVNSFDVTTWDITANSGYNYHVAGIGRDSISDLNQKQSKTVNIADEVTIGLGGIFTANSANTNEFAEDGDFLVWGTNNGSFTGSNTNTVTIASGITTSLTRIDRKWKIVETVEVVNSNVGDVYVSIPTSVFSGFPKASNEEYALIVADNDTFGDSDIIDVIPLKSDGGSNLQTWYDFDGTKYFTFGKVVQLQGDYAIGIASGDYLIGEKALNLNVNDFTISTWVKCDPSNTTTRTVMSKGDKLQLRLNASHQVEVMIDDSVTPRFTTTMTLSDNKWHQITFIYESGTVYIYIDGVLDKSEQNVSAPSPNFNRFTLGALYLDKNNIINPLLGEIDEVYVWDQGLSEEQVRYLMNQQIERFDVSGTDYASGSVLPFAASSNEVATIPWSTLRAYYNFNSFYGSTIEGQTSNPNFLRLRYLDKTKSIVISQTAPLPYVTTATGAWDTVGSWQNGTVQPIPNTVGLDGSTIVDWNIVEMNHDLTSGDRDITLLGLKQNSGTLTIANPSETLDETNSGHSLTISHYYELDGILDLVGESQLIQRDGSVLDDDSGGYLERDQQGMANSFNYNYWALPIAPISGNTSTRGSGVSNINSNNNITSGLFDGTSSSTYLPITFNTSYSAADSGTVPSPIVISSYWFYKFYGEEDDYYAWQHINQGTMLKAGEGYTMKGSSGPVALTGTQNYVFKGRPYNGDITLALDNSSQEVARLVGNPYPSALDIHEFILDNMSVADGGNNTETVFNGALYFWDHFGEENSHYLADYVGGYATRNLITGVAAISDDYRINNTSNAGGPAYGVKIPGPYVAVGQGFFLSTALDGFDNNNGSPIAGVDGGTIRFSNNQRAFVREDVTNSQFFRNSSNNQQPETILSSQIQRVIKLMYDSPEGMHRQIAVGTNTQATNGFEMGFDAFIGDLNQEDAYWIIEGSKFVIQGVHDFNVGQEFPLGIKVHVAGTVRIKIDELIDVDSNTNIYIKDGITNQHYDLLSGLFETFLNPGTYEKRFSLVFETSDSISLSTDENLIQSLVQVYYQNQLHQLNISIPREMELKQATVYSILGQEILHVSQFEDHDPRIPLRLSSGVYIVKLETTEGTTSRKFIID